MNQPTIFLVEDNPDDVELTLKVLQDHHFHAHVEVARDGAEAVAFLTGAKKSLRGKWPPHVILLDLNLPKLPGLAVLRHLRNDPLMACTPVIVLTTSDDAHECDECYNEGATSFIRKPVAYEQFEKVIQQLGHYWLDLNMPPPRKIQGL
ncbi:MAG: response regulator [Magnetococcales bacterium]|nr:response regulator [Magnetococcales bacterium]